MELAYSGRARRILSPVLINNVSLDVWYSDITSYSRESVTRSADDYKAKERCVSIDDREQN